MKLPSFVLTQGQTSHLSVAFGLWMLLAGIPATAKYSWEEDWTFALLTGSTTALGVLLLLEAYRAGKSLPDDVPSLIEVTPGLLMRPDPTTSRSWAMAIPLHLILQTVFKIACFFGGGLVGAWTYVMVVTAIDKEMGLRPPMERGSDLYTGLCIFGIAIPCFFGGAVLGMRNARRLFLQYIPARCPQCPGLSYCKIGNPITYCCKQCGYVYKTMWYERGGG